MAPSIAQIATNLFISERGAPAALLAEEGRELQ